MFSFGVIIIYVQDNEMEWTRADFLSLIFDLF